MKKKITGFIITFSLSIFVLLFFSLINWSFVNKYLTFTQVFKIYCSAYIIWSAMQIIKHLEED